VGTAQARLCPPYAAKLLDRNSSAELLIYDQRRQAGNLKHLNKLPGWRTLGSRFIKPTNVRTGIKSMKSQETCVYF